MYYKIVGAFGGGGISHIIQLTPHKLSAEFFFCLGRTLANASRDRLVTPLPAWLAARLHEIICQYIRMYNENRRCYSVCRLLCLCVLQGNAANASRNRLVTPLSAWLSSRLLAVGAAPPRRAEDRVVRDELDC